MLELIEDVSNPYIFLTFLDKLLACHLVTIKQFIFSEQRLFKDLSMTGKILFVHDLSNEPNLKALNYLISNVFELQMQVHMNKVKYSFFGV